MVKKIMTLAFFVLIQYRSVTDRRTDGQTDGRTDGHLCSGYTSACIARYANALVKIGFKFSVLATITSGLVGVSSQNIFHATCREAGVITYV